MLLGARRELLKSGPINRLRASYQQLDSESDKEKQPPFAILLATCSTVNNVSCIVSAPMEIFGNCWQTYKTVTKQGAMLQNLANTSQELPERAYLVVRVMAKSIIISITFTILGIMTIGSRDVFAGGFMVPHQTARGIGLAMRSDRRSQRSIGCLLQSCGAQREKRKQSFGQR